MLFKRYASPFLLLDNYISISSLESFIDDFDGFYKEDLNFEFYLHKVFDKTYDDWKRQINVDEAQTSLKDTETTVKDSFKILSNFKPQEIEE